MVFRAIDSHCNQNNIDLISASAKKDHLAFKGKKKVVCVCFGRGLFLC